VSEGKKDTRAGREYIAEVLRLWYESFLTFIPVYDRLLLGDDIKSTTISSRLPLENKKIPLCRKLGVHEDSYQR